MPPTCLLAEGTCLSFPYLPHLPRFFFNSRAFEALGCAVHVQKTTNTVPTWGINQECNAPVTQNCKLETCAFEWRKGISQSQVRRGKKLGSRGWNELFERGKNKNSQGRRPVSARLAPTRTAWQKEKNTYVGDWPKNKRHSLGAARGTRLRGSTPRCQARMQSPRRTTRSRPWMTRGCSTKSLPSTIRALHKSEWLIWSFSADKRCIQGVRGNTLK